MRHLLRSVAVLSVFSLSLSLAAHADTFAASASFTDTSSNNNDYQFTGSFATSPFSFSGGVGTTYTDQLTIDINNASCTGRNNPCNGATDNLSVTIGFTSPNAQNSGFSGTGDQYFTFGGFVEDSDINWTTNSQVVTFSDGSSVLLSLPDFTSAESFIFGDSNTEDLTVKVLSVPTAAAPEPSSLMLLGTGLLSSVAVMRRKLAR